MNGHSSRSHAICMLTVTRRRPNAPASSTRAAGSNTSGANSSSANADGPHALATPSPSAVDEANVTDVTAVDEVAHLSPPPETAAPLEGVMPLRRPAETAAEATAQGASAAGVDGAAAEVPIDDSRLTIGNQLTEVPIDDPRELCRRSVDTLARTLENAPRTHVMLTARLTLVDLAGSERVGRSGVSGVALKEVRCVMGMTGVTGVAGVAGVTSR